MTARDPLRRIGQPPPIAFELLAEIATGPTARVELCRIREPAQLAGKLCAVKRLHPHIAEDPHFYSMFVDEVWMTAALDHPNVARVVGWGTDAEGTYLAVELIEGVSLARLMKTVFETREAFTERMVVYLGLEICAGLSAAHGLTSADGEHLHLVHRDLTPGNVLIGFDGRVLIADFGLAKAKQRVTKTLTGLLKGHPQYMAPEQATDAPIDGRADLFSVGVVLFELFSGRHPWTGGNEIEVFHVMAKDPPADLAALRPKIDRELLAVVSRLLEKDPARRFSSAAEVYERLANWLDTHGYKDDNADAVARFVRRNAMRQMRWFERAIAGEFVSEATRAKARLLGARVRGARTVTGASFGTGPSLLSKPASAPPAPMPSSSPARRRARRIADDATDVSDIEARFRDTAPGGEIAEPPSGETPDWGEEIPTVVKPNLPLTMSRAGLYADRSVDIEALPSFADEESDGRTTTVKSGVAALVARESVTRPRSAPTPRNAAQRRALDMPLGNHGTSLNLPAIPEDFDTEESEEVPTHPIRARPRALPKLPPPVQRPAPPVRPKASEAEIADEPTTLPRERRRPAKSEADVRSEAERMAELAARLRAEAERVQKLAAHKGLLAQLAFDACELADEAVRALASSDFASARTHIDQAHRLEDVIMRGEAEGPGTIATGDLGPTSERAPVSPARGFTEPARISVAPTFGNALDRVSEPPPSPAFPAPQAAEPQPERSSFLPPLPAPPMPMGQGGTTPEPRLGAQTGGRPRIDPRKEPTAPSTRYLEPSPFGQSQVRQMLSGEVFGVPVPVALAVAFLIALAMVVLVYIVAG